MTNFFKSYFSLLKLVFKEGRQLEFDLPWKCGIDMSSYELRGLFPK